MQVSVVTTVYNGEAYFHRALPSILQQTRGDLEYVILNDGSTDSTLIRLEEAATNDPRIRLLRAGRLGRARALNAAVNQAQGEYIAIQDFDDESYPERLEKQAEFLDTHPDIDLVGAYYVLDDMNRGERYIRMPPESDADLKQAMARYIPFAHTMVMYRKSAWQAAGGYPMSSDLEDLRLWIAMAQKGSKFATLPETLGVHYVHKDSFWHTHFAYRQRQRELSLLQIRYIREGRLPVHSYAYPLGRFLYGFLPTSFKRLVRRTIGGSTERLE